MMPNVDLTKTTPHRVSIELRGGVWSSVKREVVQRALHNCITYGSGQIYGTPVDESDCNQILSDMDRSAS